MSKESYDRARAEYIKSHSRAERLRRAFMMSCRISNYIQMEDPITFDFCGKYLIEIGYDLKQINALSESIKSGITCKTIHSHYWFLNSVLLCAVLYETYRGGVAFETIKKRNLEEIYIPESNPQMVLRAAFRELEHALITLPRTTISKKETVADATHSS